MKAMVLLMGLLVGLAASAQESWKIRINGRTVLAASAENPEKNVVRVKASSLRTGKPLEVIFLENNDKKEWDRYLALYDTSDNELIKKESARATVSGSRILALLRKHKKLIIYTWMLPTDPDLRSRIRIRRIHLCTLVLQ